jgi:hypothetical protein
MLWLAVHRFVAQALDGLSAGNEIIVLTWSRSETFFVECRFGHARFPEIPGEHSAR